MFDLISIGDTVIDTYIPLTKAEIIKKHQGNTELLVLPFGAKVPVENSTSIVAGNASNSAVGSSRLGLKTAIYTNVGNKDDDTDDDRIKAKLKKEGVSLDYIVETDDLPSNHNIILNFQGGRTILTHHQPWKFNLPDLDRSRWVYLTSLSPSYVESNVIEQLINYIERNSVNLAYQPGTFQIKQGLKKQKRLLYWVEVFFVNLEEAKTLLEYEISQTVDIKKLLNKLHEYGPRQVVITDGQEGSYGFDGEEYFHLKVFPAKLVEATGAGDSFATATVAGLFYGHSLKDSLRWGAANSASVIEQIGPQAGLLTLEQIQKKLKENKNIIAQSI